MAKKTGTSSKGTARSARGRDDSARPDARRAAVSRAAPSQASTNGDVPWLIIRGAAQNNLRNVDAAFPLGRFTCVTGVSGSGKSSLVNDILYAALARDLNQATTMRPGRHAGIDGLEHLDKIIAIDQSPIGRTPRSNPATYIKVFDEIRTLFTKLPDAKLRGYKPGRFSFNVPARRGGGRCEACEGNGATRIEMDFLADVWVTCPVCSGARFTRETLQMRYKGASIGEVLEMDVQQALDHFENVPRVRGMLQTLHDVGLDYVKLGQPSTTLSGGEAQRIKLARELVKKATGRTMYVLDEPTTGLHFEDIRKLLQVLHGFVDAGNTVVVIEHNLDVIKTADWLLDLGPEGGEQGGLIVAEGTPEDVAANEASYTGIALREELGRGSEDLRIQGSERSRRGPQVVLGEEGVPKRDHSNPQILESSDPATITVVGAREHNLKDLTVSFPRDQITVCTGVSGSGKTSFAIDTVFTEGYRRYVESLSAYARQFLGQMAKPRVDHVHGLSPAICIEQKSAGRSPRSTVGTITEIYDYMRVLWARIGKLHCLKCNIPVGSQTSDEIIDRIMSFEPGAPIMILAPVTLGDGETYPKLFQRLKSSGYTRVRIDGEVLLTAQATTLDARRKHRVEVVVDRTVVRTRGRGRIAESVEHALALGNGVMYVLAEALETVEEEETERQSDEETKDAVATDVSSADDGPEDTFAPPSAELKTRVRPAQEYMFSLKLACPSCGTSYEELGPHHFSYNSHLGWCETCEGLGVQRGAPANEIVKRPTRSLFDGAIAGWGRIDPKSDFGRVLTALCAYLDLEPTAPLREWTAAQRRVLMFGSENAWIEAPQMSWSARNAAPAFRFQWRGFFPTIDAATRNSWTLRHKLHNMVTEIPCVTCRGGRLRPDAANVRIGPESSARSVVDVCEMPLSEASAFFRDLRLDSHDRKIATDLLKEIRDRLQFLLDVGLEYLTLHRSAPTLSGGEAQRIRLASQIGSGLSGVLYVLDEPTIGLHPRDNRRLVTALQKLRDLGNTLLIVEHDREVIGSADRLLDFGPRAGTGGGRVVDEGPTAEFLRKRSKSQQRTDSDGNGTESLTRAYLSGEQAVPIPSNRRPTSDLAAALEAARAGTLDKRKRRHSEREAQASAAVASGRHRRRKGGRASRRAAHQRSKLNQNAENADNQDQNAPHPEWLVIRGARHNNLNDIDVPIPLGRFSAVTGVSGSGKSSLVNDILWPAAAALLQRASLNPGEHDEIAGLRAVDKVINVDQSPIGTTPSSNPATYTGAFDGIRELFARLPDSKIRGYTANRFSFNRPGGRCEPCQGYGQRCIEMHFMPDVWIECETCGGKRYNPETLAIRFKGKSIADVLEMSVAEALELFNNVPRVRRMLQTLADVGLDYVPLGQPAPTLSGGEAQRVKLAGELGKPDTGRTLYILDEPTTGLHFDDVNKLLTVIQRLADLGNTVVVIEHNLDVIKCADWVIDLGPEAGDNGGYVVALGTPEELVDGQAAIRAAQLGTMVAANTPSPDEPGAGDVAVEKPSASNVAAALRAGRSRSDAAVRADEMSESPVNAPPRSSHTAAALAPILKSGPHAERKSYDPAAHAAREIEAARAGFGEVGREVKMPWQVDGRKWHLEQRTSREGKQTRWEPAALEYVLEQVHKAGDFADTNWNERASVEVTASGAKKWFLHALTGGEWLLELYFRVPPGTFDWEILNDRLNLPTLDERDDLQTYGDWARVDVRERQDGLDAVAIYVYDKNEISTPAFRKFVKDAAKAYLEWVQSE